MINHEDFEQWCRENGYVVRRIGDIYAGDRNIAWEIWQFLSLKVSLWKERARERGAMALMLATKNVTLKERHNDFDDDPVELYTEMAQGIKQIEVSGRAEGERVVINHTKEGWCIVSWHGPAWYWSGSAWEIAIKTTPKIKYFDNPFDAYAEAKTTFSIKEQQEGSK